MGNLNKLIRFAQVAWHYKRGSTILPYKPLRLWIEPTSFCNLKCPMCTSKDIPQDKVGYMDWNLYTKIIDEAKDFVYDINLFMGGESLFHKRLPDMIQYAKERGIGTRLSTNATVLTEEKRRALLDAGLDFIIFSFDGYEKEVYEKIRVNANFEKTLGNIKAFLEEKKRRGSKKPYVVFQVIEFGVDENERDKNVPAIGNISVDRRGFLTPPEQTKETFLKNFEGLPIDRSSIIQPHTFGGKVRREQGRGFRPVGQRYVPCTFLWYSMSIRWDGMAVPCCVDLSGEMPVGDVRKDSLLKIWNGNVLAGMRGKIAKGEYAGISLCSNCDILWKEQVMGIPLKSIKELKYFLTGTKS
ncbi:MAG: radical SAM protein [Nitrospirae bacterium]|nr:radical SAM protein [Nitrospirota bacterium]